jgi:cell division septum initiation protein DivIVA
MKLVEIPIEDFKKIVEKMKKLEAQNKILKKAIKRYRKQVLSIRKAKK